MNWKAYKHLLGTMTDPELARELSRNGHQVTHDAVAKARRRYGIPAYGGDDSAKSNRDAVHVQQHPVIAPLRTTPFPPVAAAQMAQSFEDWATGGPPWDAWPDGALEEIQRAVELNEAGQVFIPLRKMVARLADTWSVQADAAAVEAYVQAELGRHSWRVK